VLACVPLDLGGARAGKHIAWPARGADAARGRLSVVPQFLAVVGDDLPRQASDSDWPVVGQVFELSDMLGKGVTVAAVSFAAYIFGSVVMFPYHASRVVAELSGYMNLEGLVKRFSKLGRIDPEGRIARTVWGTERVLIGIMSPITGSTMASFRQARDDLAIKVGKSDAVRYVQRNRYDMRTRLMVADKELFGEYDRLTAESQFRINIALPLALTLVTLLITASLDLWWSLVAAIAIIVLLFQGLARDLDAVAVLMRAIIVGKITASYLTDDQSKNEEADDAFVTSTRQNRVQEAG
jgi:hypothetical protein